MFGKSKTTKSDKQVFQGFSAEQKTIVTELFAGIAVQNIKSAYKNAEILGDYLAGKIDHEQFKAAYTVQPQY